jgi:hypothetical protein
VLVSNPFILGSLFYGPEDPLPGFLLMGKELVATLMDENDKTRSAPMLNWLQGACTRLGADGLDRRRSILLNVNLEATAPDARVVKFMRDRLAPFQKPDDPLSTNPTRGAPTEGAPILPAGTITARAGEKEYFLFETTKIEATCGIDDAH